MEYEIVHVIDVTARDDKDYALTTYYNEASPINAVGSVQALTRNNGSTRSRTFLGANFQLNAMWLSVKGNLWVVDDQGDVFTNANINFKQPPFERLKFNSGSFDIKWNVTEVFKGQLNAIWGTSDEDVWVTAFAGPAFHWDAAYKDQEKQGQQEIDLMNSNAFDCAQHQSYFLLSQQYDQFAHRLIQDEI